MKHNGYIVGIEWECIYIYILVILLGIIEYVYIYMWNITGI